MDKTTTGVQGRALHWVLKIGNLAKTLDFLENVLGMRVLRHEEYHDGCDAECNGAYDRPWSKTMIGFGPEKDHFVLELTYNYGIHHYSYGNDLRWIGLYAPLALERALDKKYPIERVNGHTYLCSPDGYRFRILEERDYSRAGSDDPMGAVSINVSDLATAEAYWTRLGMKVYQRDDNRVVVGFAEDQCKLELCALQEPIDHAEAYGRIAFATPDNIEQLAQVIRQRGGKIHTAPIRLETPGKADVDVVILLSPDDYEICFVGEEGFDDLSAPEAGAELIDWEKRRSLGT
jgi:catechol 2,3-dioxygenase-like lactoylglutathione lyase family enzyme